MSAQQAAPKMVHTIHALVRDANGKPCIDGDPRQLHQSIIDAMSAEEFAAACREYDERTK